MSEYNYKIKKWADDDAEKFAKKHEKLKPGKENNFVSKEVIYPTHRDADEAYSGTLMMWQNENKSYTIGFFFGYYCGDVFFERTTDVKEGDIDRLTLLINKMHQIYCNEKMIDEVIQDEKEGKSHAGDRKIHHCG